MAKEMSPPFKTKSIRTVYRDWTQFHDCFAYSAYAWLSKRFMAADLTFACQLSACVHETIWSSTEIFKGKLL